MPGMFFQTETVLRLLLLLSFIGFVGCGGDDDDGGWVGSWSVESIDGESVERGAAESFAEEFDDVETEASMTYEFGSDGTMEWNTSIKLEAEGVSLSGGAILRGSYTLTGDTFVMEIDSIEGSGFMKQLLEEEGESLDTIRGTWVRDGSTLTLTDDDDSVIVLKKE